MSIEQLEQHVIELVQSTVRRYGLPVRPTPAKLLIALGLPPARAGTLPGGIDGCRSSDQVFYSAALRSVERITFTVFHEVLHILLEDDDVVQEQLHEHFYSRPLEEKRRVLEHLCNTGAAEFLLPVQEFRARLREQEWQLASLEAVAGSFQASLIAAAFQFAHCYPSPCTILVCEEGALSDLYSEQPSLALEPGGVRGECLCVAYMSWSSGSYPMCTRVPVPREHLIYQAWTSRTAAQGEECGFFRKPTLWKMPCDVTCIGSRVFAAFYPKGRAVIGSEQLSLFD